MSEFLALANSILSSSSGNHAGSATDFAFQNNSADSNCIHTYKPYVFEPAYKGNHNGAIGIFVYLPESSNVIFMWNRSVLLQCSESAQAHTSPPAVIAHESLQHYNYYFKSTLLSF